MATQKFSLSPYSSPLAIQNSNILQPKRLNQQNNNNTPSANLISDPGSVLSNRRILGQKGQLPLLPLSSNNGICHLSNQQFTTLLRNSPIIDNCNNSNGSPIGSCNNNTNNSVGVLTPSTANTTTTGGYNDLVRATPGKRAPTTMAKRNARERNRVKQVNQGFQTLRQHIPETYRMKKMSKVDTLRCALDYIRNLERILLLPEDQEASLASPCPSMVTTLTSSPNHSSTISPSTSLIFSSEEDEMFMNPSESPVSSRFLHNQNVLSGTGFNKNANTSCNTNSEKNKYNNNEDCEMDDPTENDATVFCSSQQRIILSSGSPYNDENNDENNQGNQHKSLGIKVEVCTTPEEFSTTDNNYRVEVVRVSHHQGDNISNVEATTVLNNKNSISTDAEMGIISSPTGQPEERISADDQSDIENYHEDESSVLKSHYLLHA